MDLGKVDESAALPTYRPTDPQTLAVRVVHCRAMQASRVLSLALILGIATSVRSTGAPDPPNAPTIDDLLKLKTIGGNQISPDGHAVAYGVAEDDFEQSPFDTNSMSRRE